MEKIKENPLVKKIGFNRIILVGVLLLMYVAFGLMTGGAFFGMTRILNTLNYAYFLGFLSLGVTFVIATGGIDFSIGPMMFCCALVSGFCLTSHGMPLAVCLIMSILIGTVFGSVNGYLVAYLKVPPFIVSLASMNIAKGIAAVAEIPSREELLSRLHGSMQSPVANFARVMNQLAEKGGASGCAAPAAEEVAEAPATEEAAPVAEEAPAAE